MKTTIFAVIFALIGINAAVAVDNKNTNIIPTPNQLVESELLPQFKAKVKMEAKGWGGKCGRAYFYRYLERGLKITTIRPVLRDKNPPWLSPVKQS